MVLEHLDDDVSSRCRLAGQEDLAHAALVEQARDLVLAEHRLAHHRIPPRTPPIISQE